MADPRTGSSRPRTPGLVNIAVVTVMVVLVAAVAFTARQQPPPTIAEFAPQAVEQIEESLPEQAQAPGTAGGTDGEGEPAVEETPAEDETETPTEAPDDEPDVDPTESEPPVEQARVRRCVGDPPRQTEDPQSPPCVPYFDGDNGGATYQGVTRDEIRVAVPRLSFGGATDEQVQLLVDHFNRRYEFYGRKLVPEFYEPTGGTFAQPNPPDMIADAVMVDEEIQAFATLGYADRKGSEHHYYDELARRGVVSSAYRAETTATEERYRRFAPYEWNFTPTIGAMLTGLGDMVCRTLSGMPPQGGGAQGGNQGPPDPLGGGQDDGDENRVFGLAYLRTPDGETPPIRILENTLAGCDVTLAAQVEDDSAAPNGSNVVLKMRDAGVTSVIYLGDAGPLRSNYMNAATNQGYFPEWVVSSYIDLDVENAFQPGNASPEQSQNVLGVSFRDKLLPRQNMPWYWAVKEGDPQADPSGGLYYPMMARYHQLLQLASGIQLAGPELTPEAFEQGLQQADFPNPGAGGPPAYQAAVDYSGRHTPSDSAMLWYYSPRDSGIVDPGVPGAVCYVNDGTRYRVGGFPAGPQPFFEDPCR